MDNIDSYIKGTWVKVEDRTPTTADIKLTMTKDRHVGLAIFTDDEWVQLLPTYLGDVYMWAEYRNEGGEVVDVMFDEPSPELLGAC